MTLVDAVDENGNVTTFRIVNRKGNIYLQKAGASMLNVEERTPRQLYHMATLIRAMSSTYGSHFINGKPPGAVMMQKVSSEIAAENPYPPATPKSLSTQEEYWNKLGEGTRNQMESMHLKPTVLEEQEEMKRLLPLLKPPALPSVMTAAQGRKILQKSFR